MVRVRFLVLAIVVLAATGVWAQDVHYHDQADATIGDPGMGLLVQPEIDEFGSEDEETADTGGPAQVSVSAYTEVSSKMSVISIAPTYKFGDKASARLRVPWVLSRTVVYQSYEASASGFGDISLEGNLFHRFTFHNAKHRIKATGVLKLPTGDNEKFDENEGQFGLITRYPVPLGSGSVDLTARVQYTADAKETGLLATMLYRLNTSSEIIRETSFSTQTIKQTDGNQFMSGLFARRQVGDKVWAHFGATLILTGVGEYEDSAVQGTSSLEQGSTLIDVYPGVSYELGLVTPYLGIRLPVVSNFYTNSEVESRDFAVVLQVSYNPGRLLD